MFNKNYSVLSLSLLFLHYSLNGRVIMQITKALLTKYSVELFITLYILVNDVNNKMIINRQFIRKTDELYVIFF